MGDPQKKISFGFSKKSKPNTLVNSLKEPIEKLEYVDSFDCEKKKFSYQGNVREEVKKGPLIIPLVGTRSAYDVIKAKLDSRDKVPDLLPLQEVKLEEDRPAELPETNGSIETKPTLEALAAKEILAGLKDDGATAGSSKPGIVIVPDMEKPTFSGEKESTLDDYENIPVDDFGMALLRGMGWTPQTGIGKESKIVAPVATKVRPKRLGLGAEGSLAPPGTGPPLKRGVLVQITAGEHKKSAGVVEGLDGDIGSVVVRLATAGNIMISENFVRSITKKEYDDLISGAGNGKEKSPETERKYGIIESLKSNETLVKKENPESSLKKREIVESMRRSKSTRDGSPKDHRRKEYRRDDSSSRSPKREGRYDRESYDSREKTRKRERQSSSPRHRSSDNVSRKARKSSRSRDEKQDRKRGLSSPGRNDSGEMKTGRHVEGRRNSDSDSSSDTSHSKIKKKKYKKGVKDTEKDHSEKRRKHRHDKSKLDKVKKKKKKDRKRSSSSETFSKKKSRRKSHSDEDTGSSSG